MGILVRKQKGWGLTQKTLVWAEGPALEEIIQEALQRLLGLFGLSGRNPFYRFCT